jgi:hypothetical protein
LWFGWFGFNGGSALASNGLAGSALTASQVAAAAAALSWMVAEWIHKGKPTALGLASGLVAGLVAVTPASGFVHPLAALVIGLLAGVVCYTMVCLKPFFKYDDSLDAFGVHGIGGFLGAVLTGVFASAALWQAGADSTTAVGKLVPEAWANGRLEQIQVQFMAACVAVAYSFVLTWILVKLIDVTFGFCVDRPTEEEGLDLTEHGELGFDLGPTLESAPERPMPEPRAASIPPNGVKRFTVVVEGPAQDAMIHTWSSLCQMSNKPPEKEFRAVYPYLTTIQGNRFRFRGGDPQAIRQSLEQLFQRHLADVAVRTHVER